MPTVNRVPCSYHYEEHYQNTYNQINVYNIFVNEHNRITKDNIFDEKNSTTNIYDIDINNENDKENIENIMKDDRVDENFKNNLELKGQFNRKLTDTINIIDKNKNDCNKTDVGNRIKLDSPVDIRYPNGETDNVIDITSKKKEDKTKRGRHEEREITESEERITKRTNTKKSRWRLNSGMLVTLVILNVTGQGTAVEVISTNTLASLLGYPSTCTLGAEVRPCTLSLTCWLRGGTRMRGCGGWLFSCCQPPDNTWDSFDNNIPSSEWQYKVSPPRLRQVPQRNVMPNNVFRRRVDDDVTQFDCGLPASRILQKRIIGGREARFAEFPWQAHVRISEFQCGGVLVSRWYVATAAHCVSRAHIRDISVWLGALDTSAGSQTARKVGVHQKILHPMFQFRMTQPDRFDIALLKLSRPISFTRHIRAICLPETDMELRGRMAVIAGWGKTDATDTHTGTNMLRSATVPILSKEQCITWHQIKQISVEIHSEMICAGHSDGHQDACLGDSGGPLIVLDNGRYYLVGITSAGFGCGVDHQPGIYHNVQVTANWIRGVISPNINYIDV